MAIRCGSQRVVDPSVGGSEPSTDRFEISACPLVEDRNA
jgi:hypothetical protein